MELIGDLSSKAASGIAWLSHLSRSAVKQLTQVELANQLFLWNHIVDSREGKLDLVKQMFEDVKSITSAGSPIHELLPDTVMKSTNLHRALEEKRNAYKTLASETTDAKKKKEYNARYLFYATMCICIRWNKITNTNRPRFQLFRRIVTKISERNLTLMGLYSKPKALVKLCEKCPTVALVLLLTLCHRNQVTGLSLFKRCLIIAAHATVTMTIGLETDEHLELALKDLVKDQEADKDTKIAKAMGSSLTVASKTSPVEMLRACAQKAEGNGEDGLARRLRACAELIAETDNLEVTTQMCTLLDMTGYESVGLSIRSHMGKFMKAPKLESADEEDSN